MKSIILTLGIGNFAFDSNYWKKSRDFRKRFIKDILRNSIGLGMTEEELTETFGADRKLYSGGIISYTLESKKFSGKKSFLNFYLVDGKVAQLKYKKGK
jgi:hypothetical protein